MDQLPLITTPCINHRQCVTDDCYLASYFLVHAIGSNIASTGVCAT